jgi:hypothetical protein
LFFGKLDKQFAPQSHIGGAAFAGGKAYDPQIVIIEAINRF